MSTLARTSTAWSWLARPSWLVAVTVACIGIPAGRAASDSGAQVTAADCAGLVLVAVVAVMVAARRRTVPPRILLIFGPLVAALGVTTVCSTDIAASVPGFLRVIEIFVLVPVAVVLALRDRRDAVIICAAVLGLGLAEAGYGIWQATTMNGAGIAGRNVRAVGTFGATEVIAMATVVGIGFIIVTAFALNCFTRRTPGRRRMVLPAVLGGLVVQGIALIFAQSRGTWITTGIAVTVMLLSFDRRVAVKTLAGCAALVIVLGGALGGAANGVVARSESITQSVTAPDRSVDDRYQLWATAGRIWNDHPLTGVGIRNFPAYRDSYASIELSSGSDTDDRAHGYARQPLLSPHNEYLLILSEQGVVGLGGFAVLIVAIGHGLWKRRCPRDPFWLAGVAFMTFLLVEFMYGDLGGSTSVLTAVMLGLAASQALGRTERSPGALSCPPDGSVSVPVVDGDGRELR